MIRGFSSFRHINDMAGAKNLGYRGTPAYHGRIMLDPETGRLLRLTIDSDLPRADAIRAAGISVEYGAVVIGERTFQCPLKSLAVTRVRVEGHGDEPERIILHLNETDFVNYHRFGSESHLLPETMAQ
jgi:hypothetical protein